ncbi:unnamed protein product [Hymenolepis diminuta]|uniref:Imidazoleglycerol-phosphate dehydratase n=1 Tax=Hymenolepis diminuta TaxID=6216 RepID=A0A0R3SFY5_HYMDI|nr:unnamed protein product [Hymenolepis diminuta]
MDPVDLTYEKMISSVVGGNSSLFNLTICEGENVHHYVGIAEIRLRLQSILDKEPDVKKSLRGPESVTGPLTASVQPERT